MTIEEQIMKLQTYKMYEGEDTVYIERDDVLKALEQQPCEDCISREAVIKIFGEVHPMDYNTQAYIKNIQNLPSVTPTRPKGKWIEVDIHNCHATLKCSVCDRIIEPTFTFGDYSYEDIKKGYPYCHCGAEMEMEE